MGYARTMRAILWSLITAIALSGCARYPDAPDDGRSVRLVFSARTSGEIRTGLGGGLPYVYIVALRLSREDAPIDDGPLPVVIPGGNGFVAGQCTHYVLFDPLSSPSYQIRRFRDETLNESFQVGVPIHYRFPELGDDRIEFEIDLNQLVPPTEIDEYRSVQVNFLSMNNRNTSGGGRVWDGLGDGRSAATRNTVLLASLRAGRVYSNATSGNVEPEGDAEDPSLDWVDWSLEVRR